MVYKVALIFDSVDNPILSLTTQVKATEQYLPEVLFFL